MILLLESIHPTDYLGLPMKSDIFAPVDVDPFDAKVEV